MPIYDNELPLYDYKPTGIIDKLVLRNNNPLDAWFGDTKLTAKDMGDYYAYSDGSHQWTYPKNKLENTSNLNAQQRLERDWRKSSAYGFDKVMLGTLGLGATPFFVMEAAPTLAGLANAASDAAMATRAGQTVYQGLTSPVGRAALSSIFGGMGMHNFFSDNGYAKTLQEWENLKNNPNFYNAVNFGKSALGDAMDVTMMAPFYKPLTYAGKEIWNTGKQGAKWTANMADRAARNMYAPYDYLRTIEEAPTDRNKLLLSIKGDFENTKLPKRVEIFDEPYRETLDWETTMETGKSVFIKEPTAPPKKRRFDVYGSYADAPVAFDSQGRPMDKTLYYEDGRFTDPVDDNIIVGKETNLGTMPTSIFHHDMGNYPISFDKTGKPLIRRIASDAESEELGPIWWEKNKSFSGPYTLDQRLIKVPLDESYGVPNRTGFGNNTTVLTTDYPIEDAEFLQKDNLVGTLARGRFASKPTTQEPPTLSWEEATAPRITAENAESIAPEEWRRQFRAAEARGDVEEGQRLRDLHALIAKQDNPVKGKVFAHSGHEDYNVFDASHFGETDEGYHGKGFYFSNTRVPEDPSVYSNKMIFGPHGEIPTMNYGPVKKYYYLYGDRVVPSGNPETNYFGTNDIATTSQRNLETGKPTEIIVGKPEHIKSADAFTYDDNGNLIDITERDNFNKNDTRYGWIPWLVGAGTAGTAYGLSQQDNTRAYGGILSNTPLQEPLQPFNVETLMEKVPSEKLQQSNTYKQWDDLSLKERAEMMKVAIRNGITNLSDIRNKYNEFALGGNIYDGVKMHTQQMNQRVKQEYIYDVLPRLFMEDGIRVKVTSGYRSPTSSVGRLGSRSLHAHHKAVDLIPLDEFTFEDMEHIINNPNSNVGRWMAANGVRWIDETDRTAASRATMAKTGATGSHFHFEKREVSNTSTGTVPSANKKWERRAEAYWAKAEPMYKELLNAGVDPVAAAGILGNIAQESGFNPNAANNIAGGHWGYLQNDKNITPWVRANYGGYDHKHQMDYLIAGLQGRLPEGNMGLDKRFNGFNARMKGVTDPEMAAYLWEREYEKSANENIPERKYFAKYFYDKMMGNNPSLTMSNNQAYAQQQMAYSPFMGYQVSNPKAFYGNPEDYQQDYAKLFSQQEVSQPLVDAAFKYSEEEQRKAERQRQMANFRTLLGMTGAFDDDGLLGGVPLLTGGLFGNVGAYGGRLYGDGGEKEKYAIQDSIVPDALFIQRPIYDNAVFVPNVSREDTLKRANHVYKNYSEAKDSPLSKEQEDAYNALRYLKDNVSSIIPAGVSNCTLTATQWINPRNPIKNASSIVNNPSMYGYEPILQEDAIPGDLLIAKTPNKDSYHTMLITGFADNDGEYSLDGKNFGYKKGEPLLTYSRGGHDASFIRTGVPLSVYNANSDGHTESLYYRYKYPNESFLPLVTINGR